MTQPMDVPNEPAAGPSTAPNGGPAPRSKQAQGPTWINVVLAIAVVGAVGGLAFAGGRLTAPAAATGFPGGGQGGNFPGGPGASPGFGGGPGGGGFLGAGGVTLEGTVESRDGDTLTIRTTGGQTIEVSLPAGTTYHTQVGASDDDVQVGTTVIVRVDLAGGGQGQGQLSASDVTVVP